MRTKHYTKFTKYFEDERSRAMMKLIKWLKKHPDFHGKITITDWGDDSEIDIHIESDDLETK